MILRHLALLQARTLAAFVAAVWGLLVLSSGGALLFGGAELGLVLQPARLADLAAIMLPEALLVALPLGLAHGMLARAMAGELAAAARAGVRPLALAAALGLPAVPLLLGLWVAVHDARPAGLAALRDGARAAIVASPERALDVLGAVGGVARTRAATHLLLPLGGDALALRVGSIAVDAPGTFRFADVRFDHVGDGGAVRGGAFASAVVEWPAAVASLGERSEHELSSRALRADGERWLAARAAAALSRGQPGDLRAKAAAALRRREWTLPCAVVGALLPLLLVRRQRVGAFAAYGLAALPGVLIGLLLPRWL